MLETSPHYCGLFLILYFMKLSDAKLNKEYVITSVDVENEKTRFRLMELGLVSGCKIRIEKKSIFKRTLLVVFSSTCFTLKTNLACQIEVCYA